MKSKILLLLVSFFTGSMIVHAAGMDPVDPMAPPGKGVDEVNGSIIHADTKKPIKDVTVTAYLSTKKEKLVLSDESGKYGFNELKPGTYKLVFEKEGFKKVIREKVSIKTDENFQLNIEMIETTAFDLMPSPFHFMDY